MCQNRESYIKMLKNLHIKQPEMVYNIYERTASIIMRLIKQPNITNTKKIEYKFDNRTFEFMKKNQKVDYNSESIVNEVENLIGNNKYRIEEISEDLSNLFHLVKKDNKLLECIRATSNNLEYIKHYKIIYGDSVIEIFQIII